MLSIQDLLPEWFQKFHIRTVYLACAVIGGAIMTIQMVLLMFGADVDADTDVDDLAGHADGFGFLSIRSVAGFLTFFGLTGLWGMAEQWRASAVVGVSLGAGLAMMLFVAWIMSMMVKLHSEGNIDPTNAVGTTGKVYLRVPGEHSGKGKVTVTLQGRSQEFEAVTAGPELTTGSQVKVVRMTSPNTFEVEAL